MRPARFLLLFFAAFVLVVLQRPVSISKLPQLVYVTQQDIERSGIMYFCDAGVTEAPRMSRARLGLHYVQNVYVVFSTHSYGVEGQALSPLVQIIGR